MDLYLIEVKDSEIIYYKKIKESEIEIYLPEGVILAQIYSFMAINKNKKDIIDKILLKELELEKKLGSYWLNNDDYRNYTNNYHNYNEFYDYEYDDDFIESTYISKRFGRITIDKHIIGKKIKMESAYSKQNLRQMKLEAILEGKLLPFDRVKLVDNLSQKSLKNLNKILDNEN